MLGEITIDVTIDAPLPEEVDAFLTDAAAQIEDFLHANRADPVSEFVVSDFAVVYRVLETLVNSHDVGERFLEWGAGLGVVAGLASMLGMEAHAIEIAPRLVSAGREFLESHDLCVEFACGSLVPDSVDMDDLTGGQTLATLGTGRDGYDELGLDLDEFDVIYVFPWPDEADALVALFDHAAAPGAILITNHGVDELMIRRKDS